MYLHDPVICRDVSQLAYSIVDSALNGRVLSSIRPTGFFHMRSWQAMLFLDICLCLYQFTVNFS